MLTNEQVLSIAEKILFLDEFQLATLQDTEGIQWLEPFKSDLFEHDCEMMALMIHTGETYDNLPDDDYVVYDIYDRDDALKEYAQNYYEDIISPEIPYHLQGYFDEELWMDDFIKELDPAEALSVDAEEHQINLFKTTYYIYKI